MNTVENGGRERNQEDKKGLVMMLMVGGGRRRGCSSVGLAGSSEDAVERKKRSSEGEGVGSWGFENERDGKGWVYIYNL